MSDDYADDVARAAAARGRSPELYAQTVDAVRVPFPLHLVNALARHSDDHAAELAAFDRLPERSRAFIRDFHPPLSPIQWEAMLEVVQDESRALAAVKALAPLIQMSAVVTVYDKSHPRAVELAKQLPP